MSVPVAHLDEAQKLTADAVVDLYTLYLSNVPSVMTLRFMDGPPGGVTGYLNQTYDHIPVKFSGFTQSSEDEKSRPTLTAMNPLGLWNSYAAAGYFDRATLTRMKVLRQHLEGNVNIYQNQIFYVGRVTQVIANQGITLELRGLADGPDQLIPARKFMPPEFAFVSLR